MILEVVKCLWSFIRKRYNNNQQYPRFTKSKLKYQLEDPELLMKHLIDKIQFMEYHIKLKEVTKQDTKIIISFVKFKIKKIWKWLYWISHH